MTGDAAGRKAAAERSALLSLAAILTHDLSNPLQSITVLCELGMEDDDPSEAPRRAEQSLQAAERMRDLLHAYSALVRSVDRPTMVSAAVAQASAMFTRRCERHRIILATTIQEDFEGPDATSLGVVSLFLAMVRAAEQGKGPFEARLLASGGTIAVSMLNAENKAVEWPEDALARVGDTLGEGGSVSFQEGTVRVRLGSRS